MSTEAWLVLAAVGGGAWWWWISQKPKEQGKPAGGEVIDNLFKKPAFVWLLIIAGVAVAFVVGVQLIYSISKPGHCEGGVSYDRAYGPDCDEWESGVDGWWFLR